MSDLYGMPELRADITQAARHLVARVGYPLLHLASGAAVIVVVLDTVLRIPPMARFSGISGNKPTLDHMVFYATRTGPLAIIVAGLWLWFLSRLGRKPLTPELRHLLCRVSNVVSVLCVLLPYFLVVIGIIHHAAAASFNGVVMAAIVGLAYVGTRIVDGAATGVGDRLGQELVARAQGTRATERRHVAKGRKGSVTKGRS